MKWPAQHPDEQIKESWAESIKTYADVPEVFKDFFTPDRGREFPYTVLTPSFNGFIHKTNEKLICDFGNEIHILERNGNTFNEICYPRNGISCIEIRTLLLNSSIKIWGVTKEGVPAASSFRFNSVTDYLFIPIIHSVRRASVDSASPAHNLELEKFDSWRRVNCKFMNYAKRSILVGEKVIHTILQPEIQETFLKVLGRTYYRVISPTLASILTDRELIIIREAKESSGEGKYGGIWDYIPLKKIFKLSLKEEENNLQELSVQLTEGTRFVYLFQNSAKREVNRLRYLLDETVIARM